MAKTTKLKMLLNSGGDTISDHGVTGGILQGKTEQAHGVRAVEVSARSVNLQGKAAGTENLKEL